jgi:hypothetical protein
MIAGNPERFAIEAEPTERVSGWILGRFRIWLRGRPIGDWDDTADLKGCARWLDDFAAVPRNRHEPGLEVLSAEEVFKAVYDPVMASDIERADRRDEIPNAHSRFHISHIGMSSFEAFDVLLLFTADGSERCLWRDARSGEIGECLLGHGEMENIAIEFCRRFKDLIEGAKS